MNKIKPKISVIIPVYNTEQYIEKCIRSLFEQTLDEIEYIFIDDCTLDKSMCILSNVIKDYPLRKNQVKIIHNEENKGIATTRNIGLKHSTGEYIIHCDSDDWVDKDLYENLYLKAISEKSDIVLCDFKREETNNSKIIKEYYNVNNEECVKAVLKSKLNPYLWNKLIKIELYIDNQIIFPDGINIREDFNVLIKLFFHSEKISKISNSYYYYRIHDNSISRTDHMRDFHSIFVQSRIKASVLTYDFLEANDKEFKFSTELLDSKLTLKILIILNVKNVKDGSKLFPETNSEIFRSNLSIHHKLILWLMKNNIYFILRTYKLYTKIRVQLYQ